jgi:hypothetical protein
LYTFSGGIIPVLYGYETWSLTLKKNIDRVREQGGEVTISNLMGGGGEKMEKTA